MARRVRREQARQGHGARAGAARPARPGAAPEDARRDVEVDAARARHADPPPVVLRAGRLVASDLPGHARRVDRRRRRSSPRPSSGRRRARMDRGCAASVHGCARAQRDSRRSSRRGPQPTLRVGGGRIWSAAGGFGRIVGKDGTSPKLSGRPDPGSRGQTHARRRLFRSPDGHLHEQHQSRTIEDIEILTGRESRAPAVCFARPPPSPSCALRTRSRSTCPAAEVPADGNEHRVVLRGEDLPARSSTARCPSLQPPPTSSPTPERPRAIRCSRARCASSRPTRTWARTPSRNSPRRRAAHSLRRRQPHQDRARRAAERAGQ
jgi:hypothetical protein